MKHRPRHLSWALLATLSMFGTASGEERMWPQVRPAEDRFKQLDKNGDGKLTVDEVPRSDTFRRMAMDT